MDRLKDDMKQNKTSPEWASDRESWFVMIRNVNTTQETWKGENICALPDAKMEEARVESWAHQGEMERSVTDRLPKGDNNCIRWRQRIDTYLR